MKRVTAQEWIVFLEFHPTLRVISILGGDVPGWGFTLAPRLGALKSDLDPIALLRHLLSNPFERHDMALSFGLPNLQATQCHWVAVIIDPIALLRHDRCRSLGYWVLGIRY